MIKLSETRVRHLPKKFIKRILNIAVEDLPPGIPKLAAVLTMSLGLYRGFLPLANRCLLRREVKLSKMAEKLQKLDADADAVADGNALYTFETPDKSDKDREKLLQDIEEELSPYCTIAYHAVKLSLY